ncbi:MAG: HAD hydrolase family protein [Eubacteriales bacterium]|nr:HAD hydrolase family protein [Eubacteriales bacterium]
MMDNKTIRMIGIDLDGTLLTMSKELTNSARKSVEEAIRAGIEVVPVTGRPLAGVPAEVLAIPGIRYIITSNGANTYDLSAWDRENGFLTALREGTGLPPGREGDNLSGTAHTGAVHADAADTAAENAGEVNTDAMNEGVLRRYPLPGEAVLRKEHMPHETVREILAAAGGEDVIREIFLRGVGYHDEKTQKMLEDRFSIRPPILRYINRSRRVVRDFEDLLSEESSHVENISLMFLSRESRDSVFGKLKKIRGSRGEKIIHVLLPWLTDLEVTHVLADKWLAVRDLADRLGVCPGQIMTLGDGDNDRPMLQNAGLGIAMGNAPDFVKMTADLITLDNEHDGAAAAIRQVLEEG